MSKTYAAYFAVDSFIRIEIEADSFEEAEEQAARMIDSREICSWFVPADLDFVLDEVVESER